MELNPILIVDDDKDDLDMIREAAACLNIDRPVYFFNNGDELAQYLKEGGKAPFLIISDVNLPNQNGFEVKKRIAERVDLKYKSVPFIFWSTAASEKQIQFAYDLPAQGFFLKPSNFEELCDTLKIILAYWTKSQHPKQVK